MKALPQQRGRIRLGLAALAAIAALTVPQVAQAAPSEDDIAKAQAAEAASAKKSRNFIGRPVPPYSVGDTWTDTETGIIYVCTTSKEA